jgi:hypothetical protein
MIAELVSMNITPVVSFYAYFNNGSSNYEHFVKGSMVARNLVTGSANGFNGCLEGDTIFDPFNASARSALFEIFSRNYLKFGQFWMWQDCDEPGRYRLFQK